jgi:tRNA(Leu) C34 or U34 (ribose-2'-O)-methylase TrmL
VAICARSATKYGVVATGAYIEVSDSLYKSIKDWLLFGKEEQKLDDFLLSRYYNEREVLDFLGGVLLGSLWWQYK